MRKYFVPIMTAILLGVFGAASLQAQEVENDGIAELILITPVAGKGPALEKAIADYHHWIASKAGHLEYNWYAVETGPDTGKYIARSGDHNWSDFDVNHDWDDEADAMFNKNIAPLIQNAQRSMTRDMDEVSHWPESFEGYTHFAVEDWYIKNGSYGEFMKGLTKIHSTLTSSGFPGYWGFMDVASGAHGNQITVVFPNRGWADMADKEPSFTQVMTKALGGEAEFASFMSEWGATFKPGGNRMVRHLPEASDYGN